MVRVRIKNPIKIFSALLLSLNLVLTGQPVLWQDPRIPPEVGRADAASETRYMRGDQQTVNSLTAYQLGTSQSNTLKTTYVELTGSGNGNLQVTWGIRVWKRSSGGSETEITSGTPVAQVTRTSDGSGIQSATWSCPQTVLSTADSVVIRVYILLEGSTWQQGGTPPIFTSGQLNNTRLDSVVWTVYYYTQRNSYNTGGPSGRFTRGSYYWGTPTYDDRIENFTYSSPASISVNVNDGVITYGVMQEDSSRSTLPGDLNDVQIATNDGSVTENFNIMGQDASGGGCNWTLASFSGSNQYVHGFCNDTDLDCSSPPTNYTALTTGYQTLDTGIAVSGTVDLQLRLTTPTVSSCYGEQSVSVTVQAVQP